MATLWFKALAPVISTIIDWAIVTKPVLATFVPTIVPIVSLIVPALIGPEKVVELIGKSSHAS
jgi:hypothetical protein